MLKIIASDAEKGNLRIAPKMVVSYAEVLYPDVKLYLERVFGCRVNEIYKCTEGPIGVSCRHGRLHINEDLVAVETLNADGTPTPPGEPCQRLIVTDLHKRSQPIIRYELNDILTISPEKCPCGSVFRVIEKIQGRADDLFWSKNIGTGEWQYIFPDYISRAIITASGDIDEYQVIQESPEEVLIRLQLREPLMPSEFSGEEAVRQHITEVFQNYRCPPPSIRIVYEKPRVNENSQKLMRIHRSFDKD